MKRTRFIKLLTTLAAVAASGLTTPTWAATPQNLTSSLADLIDSTGYEKGDEYTLTFTVDTFNTTGYSSEGFYFLSMDPASSNKGYFLITNAKATQFGLSSDDNKLRNTSGDISSWATSSWNATTQTNSYSSSASGSNYGVYGWISKGSNGSTSVTSWNGTTFTVSYDGSDTSITATNNGITNSITLSGASFDVNDFAFGGDKDGSYRSGITAGSGLTFTVGGTPVPPTPTTDALVWIGTGSSQTWSTTSTKKNWGKQGDKTGSTDFSDGKAVLFSSEASTTKRTLDVKTVNTPTMTVWADGYTFKFEEAATTVTANQLVIANGVTVTISEFDNLRNVTQALNVTGSIIADGTLNLSSAHAKLAASGATVDVDGSFTLTGSSTQAQALGTVKMDEGETFTVNLDNSGATLSINSIEGEGKLVKNGASALNINGDVSLAELTIASGSGAVTITGSGDSTVGTLTMDKNTNLILAGGKLTVVESMENAAGSIQVTQDAELTGKVQAEKVGIDANKTATFTDGLKAQGVEYAAADGVQVTNKGGQTQMYDIAKQDMSVAADTLTKVVTEVDVTDMNKFNVSSIVNQVGGTLWLAGMTQQETIEVKELSIGNDSTVKITAGVTDQAQELTIKVKETLSVGAGSTLLANLDLKSGSILDLGGSYMYLGSELTLQEGLIQFDEATLEAIAALDMHEIHTLFQAVNDTTLFYQGVGDGDWARTHFDLSSITDADYKIVANDNVFGIVKTSDVPEPATATLSLLALMALAARRRRK